MTRWSNVGIFLAAVGALAVGCSDDPPTPPMDSGVDAGDSGDVVDTGTDVGTDIGTDGGGGCPGIQFVRPTDTAVLGVNDDTNRSCEDGFAYNVQIATNAAVGTMLELRVNGRTAGTVRVDGPTVNFNNVSLDTAGQSNLEVRVVGGATACGRSSVSVNCATPRCQITAPSRSALVATDSTAAMGAAFATGFTVSTDIEDGQTVALAVSGRTEPLRAMVMGGMATFNNVEMSPDGTFRVRATCTNRAANVGTSAESTFTVDSTLPTLEVQRPMMNAVIGLSSDSNTMRDGNQFQVCARSDAAGQQLCAAVSGSNPDMAGCTTVPAQATADACVEVTCPDGTAPFDVEVRTSDAAGNIRRQTITGVRCQSTLPSVRIVAPAAYDSTDAMTVLNVARDTSTTTPGLQTDIVVCSDRTAGMARLFFNSDTNPTGMGVALAPTMTGDPCASAGMGFVGIARFTGVTIPETFPERTRPGAPAPTAPTVRARVTDSAMDEGTSTPVALYVDSVAPQVTIFGCNAVVRPNQSDGSATADIQVQSDTYPVVLTLAREGETPVMLTLNEQTSPAGVGRFVATALRPGVTTATLRAVDPAGNASATNGMCTFTVANPPLLSFTAPVAMQSFTSSRTTNVTLSTDAPVGTVVSLSINSGTAITAPVATGGVVTFTNVTLPEADAVTLQARTAAVPNRGVAETSITVRVDTQAPTAPGMLAGAVPTTPASARRSGTVRLTWQEGSDPAPGGTGTRAVARYEIRRLNVPPTAQNFTTGLVVANTLVPGTPGASSTFELSGLAINAPEYVAIRSFDAAGNASAALAVAGPFQVSLITEQVLDSTAALGEMVSGGSDLNGDGRSDVIVASSSVNNTGIARIYYGATTGLSATAYTEFRGISGDRFGTVVASLGDVNGDGLGDVAIGAPSAGTGPGTVFIFFGRMTWRTGTSFYATSEADVTINGGTGEFAAGRLGSAIARLGDFDGDGLADVAIGAPGTTAPVTSTRGAAVIFRGRRMWPATLTAANAEVTVRNAVMGDNAFGRTVNGGGRVVGNDTRADLIIGAGSNTQPGAVYVVAGREITAPLSLLSSDAAFSYRAEAGTPTPRRFIANGVGDINGDGRSDIAIGSFMVGPGAVSLFFGTTAGTLSAGPSLVAGPGNLDVFGISLGNLIDPADLRLSLRLPQPTGSDLLVSAEGYNGQNPSAYVFTPRSEWTGVGAANANLRFSIEAPAGRPITSFTWIGDFDGDGFQDAAYGQPVGSSGLYIVR